MKTTEIRFIPKTERSRDLLYCERASCDRSLRIFCQDSSVEQYKFLLKAYREIISTYLSVRDLVSPILFINSLIRRLERIYHAEGLIFADLKGVGLHLVVQEKRTFYFLTTAEDRIHIGQAGRYKSLANLELEGVERLDTLKLHTQEELFPQRLQDIFTVSRISVEPGEVVDCLLGCPERDIGSLQAAVQDLGAGDGQEYQEQSLETLNQKSLYLRLDASSLPGGRAAAHNKRDNLKVKASFGKVHTAVIIAITVVAVMAGTVWLSGRWGTSPEMVTPDSIGEDIQTASTASGPTPIEEVSTDNMELDPTETIDASIPARIRLSLGWKNDYSQPVTSSPVVIEQQVFFGCRDGYLYALNRETGELSWKYKAADGIGASPAVRDGQVVGADYTGAVFSLEAGTGNRRWHRKLPAKVVSSPCLSEQAVFVGCFDGLGYCLSLATGDIIWRQKTGGKLWGSAVYADGRFIFPSYDGNLYALEAGTGEVAWVYKIGGNLVSSPAVSGNLVLLGAPDGQIHAVDIQSGELGWVFKTGGPVKSALAADSEHVYVGTHDRHLYCLNTADGSLVWKFETGGFIFGRPVLAAGSVFFGSYDQTMYCLDARSGKLIDRFDTEGKIYSSPGDADGYVLFGNNAGEFFCLAYADEKKF
jgi:outer membrane protein assembly factor BamB